VESLDLTARRASALLKAMGNPHRLTILCRLIDSERSVGELERIVGLSQSALSQHLARLRRDNLVKTRRSAQTIYYSLAGHEASTVLSTLYQLYCCDHATSSAAAEDYASPRMRELSVR
jgi:ArsR family transcriptional regulator, virulence genes transcriptional regulator